MLVVLLPYYRACRRTASVGCAAGVAGACRRAYRRAPRVGCAAGIIIALVQMELGGLLCLLSRYSM